MSVGVGDKAPAFSLPATGDATISLDDFADKAVVLVFYPGDDTPVCTKQLNSYSRELDEFESLTPRFGDLRAKRRESRDVRRQAGLEVSTAGRHRQDCRWLRHVGPWFPRRSVFIVDRHGVIRYAHRAIAG
jgi:peroxiredoxin Q/BCP